MTGIKKQGQGKGHKDPVRNSGTGSTTEPQGIKKEHEVGTGKDREKQSAEHTARTEVYKEGNKNPERK